MGREKEGRKEKRQKERLAKAGEIEDKNEAKMNGRKSTTAYVRQ